MTLGSKYGSLVFGNLYALVTALNLKVLYGVCILLSITLKNSLLKRLRSESSFCVFEHLNHRNSSILINVSIFENVNELFVHNAIGTRGFQCAL